MHAVVAERLAVALEAGELGTWLWDLESGTTEWDPAMEALFGLAPGTFDGTFDSWVSMLHPDDRERVLATVQEAMEKRSSYQLDHRVIWPDGSVHWLQGRGSVILAESGAPLGTVGCTADITERMQREEAVQELAARAADAAEGERRQRRRVEFLARIHDAALESEDHSQFMRSVTRLALPVLGDFCVIHYRPEPTVAPMTEIAHVDPARSDRTALLRRYADGSPARVEIDTVIRTRRTSVVSDVDDRPDAAERATTASGDALRTITVPLVSLRGAVGAIQFALEGDERRFTSGDLTLAEAASGRVAAMLDNMWLTDQQRRIAATLQESLLPHRLPDVPGLDAAVRYWAAGTATEVGGDFYDLFPIGDQRWAVVIGDVCGTGPTAASLTAVARHTIRAAARHDVPLDQVLSWANDAVLATESDLFCTVSLAVLEARPDGRWLATFATGGHPPPVAVSGIGPFLIPASGPLLGVLPTVTSTLYEVLLEPGDAVVMYTDGVTDLPPPHGLDEAGVLSLVHDAVGASPDAPTGHDEPGPSRADRIAHELGQRIERRVPVVQRGDDIALVVLAVP